MPDFKRKVIMLVGCVLLGCMLSGCGKRAAHVDPPPDVEDDRYPFIYPDPATDPSPSK